MVTKRTLANHKTIKIWGVGIGAGMLSVLLKQAQKEEPLDGRRVPMSTRDQQLNSIWERSKFREDECLSARKILEVSTQQIAERMVAELPFPTLAYTLERRSCLMNTISPLVQFIGKSLSLSCFEFEACNILFRVSLIPRAEGVRAWEKIFPTQFHTKQTIHICEWVVLKAKTFCLMLTSSPLNFCH